MSLLQIDGYTLILKGKTCCAHGGLLIYLQESYEYKNVITESESDIWEGQFISVTNPQTNLKLTLGNIYRPPRDLNENYKQFTDEFTVTLAKLHKSKGDVVITGDFNIDLLKLRSKPAIKEYLDSIMANSFFPKITLPTRFSEQHGTLIDNALCKLSDTFFQITSGIIVSKLSDHLPYFLSITQTKTKQPKPKYIYVRQNTEKSINEFKTELQKISIYEKLDKKPETNPNINYDILNNIMSEIHDNCMSPKKVKFNKHKHAKCDWITQGIIKSIQFRDNLYSKMKQTPSNTPSYLALKTNLKTYNKILKRNIEQAKRLYYETSFNKYKNDSKGTWKMINELTNRTNHKKQLTTLFKVDGEIVTERNEIANKFNNYFTNIGPLLASKINTNCNKTFEQFMPTPSSLPSKNSSGVDGISPKLLKTIKNELIKPVTLIINQCINTGIFPDKLKVAKVVPVFKSNDATIFSNYRPISILPTI